MLTRAAQRRRNADALLGTQSKDAWLPPQLQEKVLDLILASAALPDNQPHRLFAYSSSAVTLAHLHLVCRSWRDYVHPHPLFLQRKRLNTLMNLSHLNDWIHFIVAGKSRAHKSKRVPNSVVLQYPVPALQHPAPMHVSSPDTGNATWSGTDLKGASQAPCTHPPSLVHPKDQAEARGIVASASPVNGPSLDKTLGSRDGVFSLQQGPMTELARLRFQSLHLTVMKSRRSGADAAAFPLSACILECEAHPKNADIIKALALEVQMLDCQYTASLIIKVRTSLWDSSPFSTEPVQGSGHTSASEARETESQQSLFLAHLAQCLTTPTMAAEVNATEGVLYLIPTYSRFRRRVPYFEGLRAAENM